MEKKLTKEQVVKGNYAIRAKTPEEAGIIVRAFPDRFTNQSKSINYWYLKEEETCYCPKLGIYGTAKNLQDRCTIISLTDISDIEEGAPTRELNEISDEDAIEVANIVWKHKYERCPVFINIKRYDCCIEISSNPAKEKYYEGRSDVVTVYIYRKEEGGQFRIWRHTEESEEFVFDCMEGIDFLRSKGYNIPNVHHTPDNTLRTQLQKSIAEYKQSRRAAEASKDDKSVKEYDIMIATLEHELAKKPVAEVVRPSKWDLLDAKLDAVLESMTPEKWAEFEQRCIAKGITKAASPSPVVDSPVIGWVKVEDYNTIQDKLKSVYANIGELQELMRENKDGSIGDDLILLACKIIREQRDKIRAQQDFINEMSLPTPPNN